MQPVEGFLTPRQVDVAVLDDDHRGAKPLKVYAPVVITGPKHAGPGALRPRRIVGLQSFRSTPLKVYWGIRGKGQKGPKESGAIVL